MATSGTKTFSLSIADAIEEAYELAGLEVKTGYDAETARRSLNIMFADWSNRGVNLWTIEQVSLDLVAGTSSYTLNSYDLDIEHWSDYDYVVINENLENCFRQVEKIIQNHKSLNHLVS